jgi:Homeodomain-like domain
MVGPPVRFALLGRPTFCSAVASRPSTRCVPVHQCSSGGCAALPVALNPARAPWFSSGSLASGDFLRFAASSAPRGPPMEGERNVVEQRYEAVMAVSRDGQTVAHVARVYGVSRQTLHKWLRRYDQPAWLGSLTALTGRRGRPVKLPRRSKLPSARCGGATRRGVGASPTNWRRRARPCRGPPCTASSCDSGSSSRTPVADAGGLQALGAESADGTVADGHRRRRDAHLGRGAEDGHRRRRRFSVSPSSGPTPSSRRECSSSGPTRPRSRSPCDQLGHAVHNS